jgi:hypothetical protein
MAYLETEVGSRDELLNVGRQYAPNPLRSVTDMLPCSKPGTIGRACNAEGVKIDR